VAPGWVRFVTHLGGLSESLGTQRAAGLFVLDVLQVRGTVPVESRSLFDVGAVKALFKHATLMASFAALGIGARSSISQRPADRT